MKHFVELKHRTSFVSTFFSLLESSHNGDFSCPVTELRMNRIKLRKALFLTLELSALSPFAVQFFIVSPHFWLIF